MFGFIGIEYSIIIYEYNKILYLYICYRECITNFKNVLYQITGVIVNYFVLIINSVGSLFVKFTEAHIKKGRKQVKLYAQGYLNVNNFSYSNFLYRLSCF